LLGQHLISDALIAGLYILIVTPFMVCSS